MVEWDVSEGDDSYIKLEGIRLVSEGEKGSRPNTVRIHSCYVVKGGSLVRVACMVKHQIVFL